MTTHGRRGAFSLIELLVVIAIIALLLSILLPAVAAARRSGRSAACQAHMHQFGVAHQSYSADFRDLLAAFNGRIEDAPLQQQHRGFPGPDDAATQARHFILEHGPGVDPTFPTFDSSVEGVYVFEQFSHLVLTDYLGQKLPMPAAICPEDRPRLSWSSKARDFDAIAPMPLRSGLSDNSTWLPYSSSYQLMPTAIFFDGRGAAALAGGDRSMLYGWFDEHDRYWKPAKNLKFGGRKQTEVLFPSLKVAVADSQQRHFGRDLYYAFPEARQPLLFWDGAVSIRQTRDANRGWNPRNPGSYVGLNQAKFYYVPDLAHESPAPDGAERTAVFGAYKWTRGGLGGIDFSGRETTTNGW